MTTTEQDLLKPGDWVSFRATMSVMPDEFGFLNPLLMHYGGELQLTQKMLAAYEYPKRESWLTRVDQPGADGVVKVERGRWATGELRTAPGTPEREREYWQAHDVAHAEPDESVRKRLVFELERKYGKAPSTQRSQDFYGGLPWERKARP